MSPENPQDKGMGMGSSWSLLVIPHLLKESGGADRAIYSARQPQLAPYLGRENALLSLRNRTHGEDQFLSENAERTFHPVR